VPDSDGVEKEKLDSIDGKRQNLVNVKSIEQVSKQTEFGRKSKKKLDQIATIKEAESYRHVGSGVRNR
jgi:hypothetical protein